MRQIKKADISALHGLLKEARMTKGDAAAKMQLVKAIIATKDEAGRFDDYVGSVRDKHQPEDYKEMQAKAQNEASLSIEERMALANRFMAYDADVRKAIKGEADKTVAVDIEPWPDEQYSALLESNDFTGAQMLLLHQTLKGAADTKKG